MLPVTITRQGTTQTTDGTFQIQRSPFDIGAGEWKDTSVVTDEILIKFHVVEAKK